METEPKNKTEITQNDLDLTEEELNRIFFGSDKKTPTTTSTQSITNKPQKLERQNKPSLTIPSVIPPDPEKIQPATEEPVKRPQGRPKIWTPEKIAQKKQEDAKLAEQRRKEKSEKIRLSKLSIQEPISHYETEKLIDSAIKTKDEIEKHLTEKRTILKNILKKDQFPFLRKTNICSGHLFKLHHFDLYGNAVVVCDHCSERQEMSPHDWSLYLARNRKKL